ncbi:MAG TPA: ATP-grasp domain-containing protein [Leptospiraceae bacterium]|nr:ATP-grasp domain-containing protein [Leptospiraceae bacterium]HMW04319.1 ATP-grasp domain-containing protein [Leptospiraceae bacterium]HMX30665.1 ATP-grasp domain-containing protein [Leptospiraceae bacterium]HMY31365.1 ATP-grasp domain-containing protein [Leptospiraceae bacterium]HMZ65374.1 ATP-grasp domain-containing protein [Leptospiraceae bacterium]
MYNSGYYISIGAGKNQLPLIHKAKQLGLKVIAVDQNKDAVGFKYSEIKILHSILDFRKIYATVLKLFLEEPIIGIGVRSYGKAVLTASYLAEKFNLINTSLDILRPFYNKKTMKAFLGQNGIPVPTSYIWRYQKDFYDLVSKVSYPCILKPVDNIAKLGIEIFDNKEELLNRLTQLKARNEKFLLEEFINGKEITVLGFVQNQKFTLVSISDKITTDFPPYLELSHQLPSKQEQHLGEVHLLCQSIVNLTNLDNSPFVAEFKISDNGKIYLIEVMPEIGGEYLADLLIPEFYQYDYFKNYIKMTLGERIESVDSQKIKKKNSIGQICFIAPPEGSSKFIQSNNVSIKGDRIFLNEKLKDYNSILNTKEGNSARVGVIGVISSSKTPEELDNEIRKNFNAKFE